MTALHRYALTKAEAEEIAERRGRSVTDDPMREVTRIDDTPDLDGMTIVDTYVRDALKGARHGRAS